MNDKAPIVNMLRYGPSRGLLKIMLMFSWPIMIAGKRLSAFPVLKWLINPVFRYPYNEVTAIPINVEVKAPASTALPQRLVEAVIRGAADIVIMDKCICRDRLGCATYPSTIGCMALGRAARRIHPSHGRHVTADVAVAHARRAGAAGLVANIAHTWIDAVAFGLPDFNRLMFICFCDDCCCLFRTHMHRRGPGLDKAYKKLPGIEIVHDAAKCLSCGACAEKCFVSAVRIENGKPVIGAACKSCGRCVETCKGGALGVRFENEGLLVERLLARVNAVADIGPGS